MLSISLGPFALPVAPLLLALAVWGASWLASRVADKGAGHDSAAAAGSAVFNAALFGLLAARLVHLALHADLYLAAPWSVLDVRDGGWHLPTGVLAGAAWLASQGWRVPALRRPLAVGGVAGMAFWLAALVAIGQRESAVGFLFVNQGETDSAVRDYLDGQGLTLSDVLLDADSTLGPAVGSRGLPTTLFYDAQGRQVDAHMGVLNAAALESRLRQLRAIR